MTGSRRGRVPAALAIPAAIAAALVLLPLIGLVGRTSWSSLGAALTSAVVVDALRLSAISSAMSTILSVVLGVPLAWVLSRVEFPGRRALRGLVLLPLVLPPVVAGTALGLALGRRGLVGGPVADATGLVLPFSIWGVVLASTFVAMPFLVITVEGALRAMDQRYEGVAATLGASRLGVFRRVTLPMIRPSLVAGTVLAWARAFGEFGATITFAGNLPGTTQTAPLAVFVALEQDRNVAVALSLVMVAVSLAVLVALRDRWFGAR